MKKIYITPIVCDFINVETQSFLSGSPTYQMQGGVDENGNQVLQGGENNVTLSGEEDEAGARLRGGDFGSLW